MTYKIKDQGKIPDSILKSLTKATELGKGTVSIWGVPYYYYGNYDQYDIETIKSGLTKPSLDYQYVKEVFFIPYKHYYYLWFTEK